MKNLDAYLSLAVLAHCAVAVWHLLVLARIPPPLSTQQVLAAAIAINVLPLAGLILLWRRFPRSAAALIFIPLAAGLVAGGSQHFLSSGPENVFHMAAAGWTLPYQISAVLLLILEIACCWLAILVFRGASSHKT